MATYNISGATTVEGVGGAFGSLSLSTATNQLNIVPDSGTAVDTTLTLPSALGSQGDVLTTDGAGTLTWSALPNPYQVKCWIVTISLANNVQSGTFTSGSWVTRVPTNIVSYPPGDTDVQISGSGLDIVAGTYRCEGRFTSYAVGPNMARVRDTGGATTLISGQSSSSTNSSTSELYGFIETAVPISIELQQRCTTTIVSTGFGFNDAFLGATYTPVSFTMIKLV